MLVSLLDVNFTVLYLLLQGISSVSWFGKFYGNFWRTLYRGTCRLHGFLFIDSIIVSTSHVRSVLGMFYPISKFINFRAYLVVALWLLSPGAPFTRSNLHKLNSLNCHHLEPYLEINTLKDAKTFKKILPGHRNTLEAVHYPLTFYANMPMINLLR